MMERFFVKDKSFYRWLLTLAVPTSLQALVMFGVNVTDSVMVGGLGEASIAGVAIANQFSFLYLITCFGIGGGMGVLTAQFWGKQDTDAINAGLSIILKIATAFGMVFFLLSLFIPDRIMGIYTVDADVIREGASYMRILSFSYLCMGLSTMVISTLRSVGVVKLGLLTNCIALLLNVLLNWIFIYGNLGAPRMGAAGAALATLVCRIVEILIIALYLMRSDERLRFQPHMLLRWDSGIFHNYLKNGVPVIVSDVLLGIGGNMLSVVLGRMGAAVMSASAIANVIYQLTAVFLMGVSGASGVITGNTVGAGEVEKTKAYSKTFLSMSFLVSIASIICIQLVRGFAFQFYDITPETHQIANELLDTLSVLTIFMTTGQILTKGILRAGGDTKFLMIADVLFLWLVSVPLGFVAGLVLHWPPFVVYFCLRIDEVIKSVWCLRRFFSWKWIRDVAIREPAP
ncbi:MAG: MATE family efflux transporter [Clostridiales bacterium]|jgi:putative MATE family efflux protein|nr:MATE family efflux transporter [Clostridiales bacterium]